MAFQLPKLSQVTKMFATPEIQFESMVKQATGFELPPGPTSTLLKLQSSLETGQAPSFESIMPKLPSTSQLLSKLPSLPPLPGIESLMPGKIKEVSPKSEEVEVKKKVEEQKRSLATFY